MFRSRGEKREMKSGKSVENWLKFETPPDKLGRTWGEVICGVMHALGPLLQVAGAPLVLRCLGVAWHQMGSISKRQLRSLMRRGSEMLKRPCPPYAGLHRGGGGGGTRVL